MLHAVIMAGGTGTRFWPASRAAAPKQLLPLVGQSTMIRQTFDRLGDLVAPSQTVVVTSSRLIEAIAKQLPELPEQSLVGEPCKRDTAPCIGLAALLVARTDPDATMAVMPADHVIRAGDRFRAAIRQAVALLDSDPTRIVTFGIRPSYPAEIFGYIHRGEELTETAGEASAFHVQAFREKPDAATARQYLESGEYYWNSGIFVWRARTILDALSTRQPAMLSHLQAIIEHWGTEEQTATFEREFSAIDGISIDYAVMEHAENVAVIEAPFDWDDLGGWQSLTRLAGTDEQGNTVLGKHLGLGTTASIVRTSDEHLVVTLGLKNCLVVHTPDATLVADKDNEEQIRDVVKELESRGWKEFL